MTCDPANEPWGAKSIYALTCRAFRDPATRARFLYVSLAGAKALYYLRHFNRFKSLPVHTRDILVFDTRTTYHQQTHDVLLLCRNLHSLTILAEPSHIWRLGTRQSSFRTLTWLSLIKSTCDPRYFGAFAGCVGVVRLEVEVGVLVNRSRPRVWMSQFEKLRHVKIISGTRDGVVLAILRHMRIALPALLSLELVVGGPSFIPYLRTEFLATLVHCTQLRMFRCWGRACEVGLSEILSCFPRIERLCVEGIYVDLEGGRTLLSSGRLCA